MVLGKAMPQTQDERRKRTSWGRNVLIQDDRGEKGEQEWLSGGEGTKTGKKKGEKTKEENDVTPKIPRQEETGIRGKMHLSHVRDKQIGIKCKSGKRTWQENSAKRSRKQIAIREKRGGTREGCLARKEQWGLILLSRHLLQG